MDDREKIRELFQTRAEAVSAIISAVKTPEEALAYAVALCERKAPCRNLIPGDGKTPARESEGTRVIAAPGLNADWFRVLEDLCREKGFLAIQEGLRDRLGGIDVGFTLADWGIAETGTLVVNSNSEELRLATMISEIHVALLPLSKIRASAFDLEEELRAMMAAAPSYTAFISGASRTADIERVLAIGVHGPLALHILPWEDEQCRQPGI